MCVTNPLSDHSGPTFICRSPTLRMVPSNSGGAVFV